MRQQDQQHDDAAPAHRAPEVDDGGEREAATARGLGAVGQQTGAPLPESVRSHFERRFRVDFADIRIRVSPEAEAVGALAYTQGTEIVFAPGAPAPDSSAGRELIGHELAHVVQQRQGRVAAGPGAGGAINDDPALEAEADQVGSAAARGEAEQQGAAVEAAVGPPVEGAVQLKADPSSPIQRKVTVNPIASKATDTATLHAMSLADFFGKHIREQLDWSSQLSDADAEPLRQLIARVNRLPALSNACGPYTVGDLLGLDAAGWTAIEKYSQGVSTPKSPPTARLEREPTLAEGKALGETTLKLEGAVGGGCLYVIAHHDAIKQMMTLGMVDSFVAYVAAAHPVLHAERTEKASGNDELRSYVRTRTLVDLLAMRGSLPRVRNLHRFDGAGLTALAAAAKDTSKKKPVTLILHSALDHNAAFHHDPNMTAVMTDTRFLPIMVEGATTLDEVTGQVDEIAKTYGPGGKIAQVMIAGHGGPRGMEMAGTVSENIPKDPKAQPSMDEHFDSIDLDSNAKKSDELFDALLRNLDGSASGHMVFNACLTGSTEVSVDPTSSTTPEDQIKETIKNSPNLTEYLSKRAKDQGVDAKVKGANGSFGQVGLADGAGKLDIINPNDPALTGSKLEYIEKGTEGEGVMRAVLQSWQAPAATAADAAAGKDTWLQRVEARLAAPKAAWNHVIIQTFFQLIKDSYQADPAAIQSFISLAHPLNAVGAANHAHVSEVEDLAIHTDVVAILKSLSAATGFAGFAKLVLLQIWLKLDPGKLADLVTELATWTVSKAENHVDTDRLDDADLATMLAPTASPTNGQLVLACIDRLTSPHKASETFLLAVIGTAEEFPAKLSIATLMGTRSADDVLATIGRGPFADKGGTPPATKKGPTTEDGNLDVDGDKSNESFAEPVQKHGKVANCYVLRVRKRPSMSAETLDFLHPGDEVFVTGALRGWDVIDFKGKPAFVGSAFIER